MSIIAILFFRGNRYLTPDYGPTEVEAKMFSMSSGYEQYMGRWSRRLAPAYVAFAGVEDGERVLDVGTGTGAVAAKIGRAHV